MPVSRHDQRLCAFALTMDTKPTLHPAVSQQRDTAYRAPRSPRSRFRTTLSQILSLGLLLAWPDLKLAVTADHEQPVAALGQAMHAAGFSVDVLLDLDTGMHRTGMEIGPEAAALYQAPCPPWGRVSTAALMRNSPPPRANG